MLLFKKKPLPQPKNDELPGYIQQQLNAANELQIEISKQDLRWRKSHSSEALTSKLLLEDRQNQHLKNIRDQGAIPVFNEGRWELFRSRY